MTRTKNTKKTSSASTFVSASIVDSEYVEKLKRRAEKLGLIIHKQASAKATTKSGKR